MTKCLVEIFEFSLLKLISWIADWLARHNPSPHPELGFQINLVPTFFFLEDLGTRLIRDRCVIHIHSIATERVILDLFGRMPKHLPEMYWLLFMHLIFSYNFCLCIYYLLFSLSCPPPPIALGLAVARDGSSGGVLRLAIIEEGQVTRQVFTGPDIPQFYMD